MLRISIVVVLYGFVQLTRIYLNTRLQFPKLDKVLVISLAVYIAQAIVSNAITVSGLFYMDYYTIRFDNILVLCLIGIILFTAIWAMYRGVPAARYFLLANIVPLGLMITLALYFALFSLHNSSTDLLPNLAVVSQAIAFAIAFVWRVNLIKTELSFTQAEIGDLQREHEQLLQRNRYIQLENRSIANEMVLHINQKAELQEKLEANQRELASNTLYIFQKNELQTSLQKQVKQLAQLQGTQSQKQAFREIKSTLHNSVQLDNDWDKFKLHFEQVHPNFFAELERKHPHLTGYEVRLCAYLYLKMTAKEIATLLNIDANSVHRAKTRLKKKMSQELDSEII